MRTSDQLSQTLSMLEEKLDALSTEFHNSSSLAKVRELRSIAEDLKDQIKNSKKAAKKDAGLYQQIFEKAPIGIIHFDQEGIIDASNEMFIRILGTSRENLLGLNIFNLENEEVKQGMVEALQGKSTKYEGQYTSITSGKRLPVRAEFHPDYNNNGELTGGITMLEDITERYEAEKKIAQSEERYRTLFEQNQSVMMLIDADDGSIYNANSAAIKYYGWTKEEITQMKISDINILPADKVREEMERARKENRSLFHFKHRLANGEIRDVEVYSGMIFIDEKYFLYSIVHDISERVTAQKELMKFKLGIENSPNMILITDTEGRIEYANKAFQKKYGYSLDEIMGETPQIIKSGRYGGEFYREYWETLLSKEVVKGEMINKTKQGEEIYISYSTNPIVDKKGNLNGFIAIQDDVTKQKKAEKELSESLEEKEVLLSEIHHRVKNNLAIISALLELNLYHKDEETTIEEFVHSSQMRIKAIAEVHEMLYQSDQFTQISFNEYIERLVRKIQELVKNQEQEIRFITEVEDIDLNINQAIPVGLMIDELLMNSMKFGFNGRSKGQIKIGLDKQGDDVLITLEDNGDGSSIKTYQERSTSLGKTLLDVLISQIEGEFNFWQTDEGAIYRIRFTPVERSGSAGHVF